MWLWGRKLRGKVRHSLALWYGGLGLELPITTPLTTGLMTLASMNVESVQHSNELGVFFDLTEHRATVAL